MIGGGGAGADSSTAVIESAQHRMTEVVSAAVHCGGMLFQFFVNGATVIKPSSPKLSLPPHLSLVHIL